MHRGEVKSGAKKPRLRSIISNKRRNRVVRSEPMPKKWIKRSIADQRERRAGRFRDWP